MLVIRNDAKSSGHCPLSLHGTNLILFELIDRAPLVFDLFLLLLFTLAVFRLRGFRGALLALIAFGLSIFLYLQIVAYVQSSDATTVSFAGITLFASSTYLILAGVGLLLLVVLGVAA